MTRIESKYWKTYESTVQFEIHLNRKMQQIRRAKKCDIQFIVDVCRCDYFFFLFFLIYFHFWSNNSITKVFKFFNWAMNISKCIVVFYLMNDVDADVWMRMAKRNEPTNNNLECMRKEKYWKKSLPEFCIHVQTLICVKFITI